MIKQTYLIFSNSQYLTSLIDGNQVDFQAVILFDPKTGKQTGYQYLYVVRRNAIGDDQLSNKEPFNPCLFNPCQNNGTCAVGFDNNFACFCLPEYTGFYLKFALLIKAFYFFII